MSDAETLERPLPEPTPTTAPYWAGLRERKVMIQYSPSSDRYVFYPRLRAPGTLADDLEWREVPGTATLYTYTITERPVAPQWRDAGPMVLAIVELDEGPRMSTEVVGVPHERLEIGMRLTPVFEDHGEVTLLKYTAAEG